MIAMLKDLPTSRGFFMRPKLSNGRNDNKRLLGVLNKSCFIVMAFCLCLIHIMVSQSVNIYTRDSLLLLYYLDSNSSNVTTLLPPEMSIEKKIQRNNVAPEGWSDVKLAIYITTHLSDSHISYLPCWNDAIQRLNIFEHADLILFTTTESADVLTSEHLALLPFRSVTVKNYTNPGYQAGAMLAMVEPFLDEVTWFDEYDWVLRMNLDVLIRNDTWLMKTMLDTSIDGIFFDCEPETFSRSPMLQSDFYAFRPGVVDRNIALTSERKFAEAHVTHIFREIYNARRFVYVEGGNNTTPYSCRIDGVHSPVLHIHNFTDSCPYYYNATEEGIY